MEKVSSVHNNIIFSSSKPTGEPNFSFKTKKSKVKYLTSTAMLRFLMELFTHTKESTVKALDPPTDLFVEEIRTFCQLRSAEQKAALLTTLKIEAFREFEKKSGFCTVLI